MVATNKLQDRSSFHFEIKKIFRHLKLHWKIKMLDTQLRPVLVMDQHLEKVMTFIYPPMLLRIPTHTQILVSPTHPHLASAAAPPSWQEATASLQLRWRCSILCRTDLNIFTVLNIVISQTNLKFSLVH